MDEFQHIRHDFDDPPARGKKKYSPGISFYIAINLCAAGLLMYFYTSAV
ncbi:hypothetical protein [Undibacterium terreum]|uniref:Uncharacterized protein n=1 Tax=Undibacterium terreum TaxID=1224302 RepID=A0A916UW42_9BURK|nr:hypothetical protein [Undibacterium terreum]GGC89611.1 hypothetical protein GCM10011396_41040 [Undibacterium terreum]